MNTFVYDIVPAYLHNTLYVHTCLEHTKKQYKKDQKKKNMKKSKETHKTCSIPLTDRLLLLLTGSI